MKNKVFHKDFQLNGNSFASADELIEYAKTHFPKLVAFLTDWFSENKSIVVSTSGSTGLPKNIALKKEHMRNSALATATYFQLFEKTTALHCLPIDFIAGKMMMVRALLFGWHLDAIVSNSRPLKNVQKRYDFSAMVPLQLSNSLGQLQLISQLIVGGGAISSDVEKSIQQVPTEIYATYGMTETITHIAIRKLNNFRHAELVSASHYKTLANVSIALDDRGCLLINAPKVSDETIITNDIVELISDTEFIWKGRYDHVINSGGIKLHPEEIEKKLSAHINSRFFVAGVADEKLGNKLVLIIEGEEDSLIVNSVRNLSILSKYEQPKEILFIDQLIETATKKIQRQKTLDLIFKK